MELSAMASTVPRSDCGIHPLALAKSGWILLGNRQEPYCRALRTSRALLPALHSLWTDTEKVCEYGLACVRLSRICRISRGLRTLGGAGISVTRKLIFCPRSYANASASDCRTSS